MSRYTNGPHFPMGRPAITLAAEAALNAVGILLPEDY